MKHARVDSGEMWKPFFCSLCEYIACTNEYSVVQISFVHVRLPPSCLMLIALLICSCFISRIIYNAEFVALQTLIEIPNTTIKLQVERPKLSSWTKNKYLEPIAFCLLEVRFCIFHM